MPEVTPLHVSQHKVFDPGRLTHNLELDCLMAMTPARGSATAIVPFEIKIGAFWVTADVLLDSGASSRNYVSTSFVDRHRDILKLTQRFRAIRTEVVLGDGITRCPIDEAVCLRLRLRRGRKNHVDVDLVFLVYDSASHELIIGLQDIRRHLTKIFISEVLGTGEMLSLLRDRPTPTLKDLENLVPPWTNLDLEAPESELLTLPCSFTESLTVMATDFELRMSKYQQTFHKQLSEEFQAILGSIDFMRDEASHVFVHQNWEGALNPDGSTFLAPFEWRGDLPEELKCRHVYVSPKLLENVHTELERLRTYHLEHSTSPYASPLTVAPKATAPFLRICADYRVINKYMLLPNLPIPVVRDSLMRLAGFTCYADIDLSNAFHQFRLREADSRKLAIKTPWGLYQPRFMPEGVTPASVILQDYMRRTFADMDQVLVIFDNILLMARDQDELFDLFKSFIRRCRERNLYLKLEKSFIGFRKVKFFGYVIEANAYQMGDERIQGIVDTPFPPTQKAMKSFLGSALFLEPFVLDFSTLAAPLHDTTKASFNYKDRTSWSQDYEAAFMKLKQAMQEALVLIFPDYDLPWYLRTDASEHGVGAVLFQVRGDVFEPIYVLSHKFSDAATRWSTYQQEAYAIFFACFKLRHWLMGKQFVIETDHNNLRWMESSLQPSIIRQRLHLQTYLIIGINHIKGKTNVTPDFHSRYGFARNDLAVLFTDQRAATLGHLLMLKDSPKPLKPTYMGASRPTKELMLSQDEMLGMAHRARGSGHFGARRTWLNCIRFFPEGNIKYAQVWDYVMGCPTCQKSRQIARNPMPVQVTTLNYDPGFRRFICMDLIELEKDSNGNQYAQVITNAMSKAIRIYPQKSKNATEAASALFSYVVDRGLFDCLRSDQGSDYTSDVFTQLCTWLGLEQRWSPAYWPQGSGAERSNRELLRHLRALLMDEHHLGRPWSNPEYYKCVEFLHNTDLHHEGLPDGLSPQMIENGDLDTVYLRLSPPEHPDQPPTPEIRTLFVSELHDNLKRIRSMVVEYQRSLAQHAVRVNPPTLPSYQPGDFILVDAAVMRPSGGLKLHAPYMGPYKVIRQHRNNVLFEDLNTQHQYERQLSFVRLFVGDPTTAQAVTYADHDQYIVHSIIAYRGEPTTRTTMEFLVVFADETQVWRSFEPDITTTSAFSDFCNANPRLRGLLQSANAERDLMKTLKGTPIDVPDGYTCYPDIRMFGYAWYANLGLPNYDTTTYRALAIATIDKNSRPKFQRDLYFPAFSQRKKLVYVMTTYTLLRECAITVIPPGDILIDADFIKQYPRLTES